MNSTKASLYRAGTILFAAAILAACGGGGGGGSSTIPPGGGGTPTPTGQPSGTPGGTATPTATATPTPTATPTTAPQFTGRVVDGNGAPIGGATITFGTTFTYAGSGYVVGGTTTTATTAADGTYTIAQKSGQVYYEVDATGLVSAHRPIPASGTTLGTVTLPAATSEDTAGLAEMNKHRGQFGSGAGAQPVTLDADLELTGRFRANDMATQGYYAHTAPGMTIAGDFDYLCNHDAGAFCPTGGSYPVWPEENIDADAPNQVSAEDAYIAEGPGGGHFNNVVSKSDLFVGFGEALNGKPAPGFVGTTANYFAELFFSTTQNPVP